MRTPRARTALLGAVAVGLAGTLSACGSDKVELTDRPAAARAVKDAVKGLAGRGDGAYSLRLTFGTKTITETGTYVLKPAATSFTRRVDDGSGTTSTVDAIALDGTFYAKGDDVQPAGCWLAGEPTDLAAASAAVYDDRQAMLPGAVIVAASARGTTYVDDSSEDVNGTLDLRKVLRLVGAGTPDALGVTGGRVNAELHIENGVLVGYTVATHDFATTDGIPLDQQATAGTPRLDVTFDNPKAAVHITPPGDDETVDVTARPRGAASETCGASTP